MYKTFLALLIITLVLISSAQARISHETVITEDMTAPVIDVAADPDEDIVFLLTQTAVLLYSLEEKGVIEQIPLVGSYTHIAFLGNDRLALSDDDPSQMSIIHYDRIYDIDITGRAFVGPADAKATIVVFSDYQCPYCARLERYIEQVMASFPDEVKLVVKHFPLTGHPFSRQGAMAALAAGKQGKFWEFHRQLLENHDDLNEQKALDIAAKLGLDMERFAKDRKSAESRLLIEKDLENGRAIGVTGTPTAFINGKQIRNQELGKLPELIFRELADGNNGKDKDK